MKPFIVCGIARGASEVLVVYKADRSSLYGTLQLPRIEQTALQEPRVTFQTCDGFLVHRADDEQDLRYVLSACRLALEPFTLEYAGPRRRSYPFLQWITQKDIAARFHHQDASAFFSKKEDIEALTHYLAL